MNQFPTHDEASAPEAARPLLASGRRAFGFAPNLFGKMAESPALLQGYLALSEIFAESTLTPLHQVVVLLTVSRYHECRYCMAAHSAGADMIKVPTEVTDAIREDRPIADRQLEALRRFTHHLVDRRGWAGEEEVEALLAAGFDRSQLLAVILGVGLKTLSNYTNHITGTELDPELGHRAWAPGGGLRGALAAQGRVSAPR